ARFWSLSRQGNAPPESPDDPDETLAAPCVHLGAAGDRDLDVYGSVFAPRPRGRGPCPRLAAGSARGFGTGSHLQRGEDVPRRPLRGAGDQGGGAVRLRTL